MTARKAVYREENADKHGYARAPDYVEHSVHYARYRDTRRLSY